MTKSPLTLPVQLGGPGLALLAPVAPRLVPPHRLPADAHPIAVAGRLALHLTLAGSDVLGSVGPLLSRVWPELERSGCPRVPAPELDPRIRVAERLDPALAGGRRRSYWMAARNQAALAQATEALLAALEPRLADASGDPGLRLPREPERLFHVTVGNVHGGDPWASVGRVWLYEVPA